MTPENLHPWFTVVLGILWTWASYRTFRKLDLPKPPNKSLPWWRDIHAGRNYALEARIIGGVMLPVGLAIVAGGVWWILHPQLHP